MWRDVFGIKSNRLKSMFFLWAISKDCRGFPSRSSFVLWMIGFAPSQLVLWREQISLRPKSRDLFFGLDQVVSIFRNALIKCLCRSDCLAKAAGAFNFLVSEPCWIEAWCLAFSQSTPAYFRLCLSMEVSLDLQSGIKV